MDVPEIDVSSAQQLLDSKTATFVDVRDPDSFYTARIPGAEWLHDGNIKEFVSSADKVRPVVVYCYKGNSSLGGAKYLLENGFKEVSSLSGGFEAWRAVSASSEQGAPEVPAPAGLSVRDLAKSKLEQYLADEPHTTRVRITVEGSKWGLSLDEAAAGDVTFSTNGVKLVVASALLESLAGLTVDFVEKVNHAGFSFEGPQPPPPPGQGSTLEDIQSRISDNKVMVFMKGTAAAPMCGFSARVVEALRGTGKPFGDKNVLEQPDYRYVLSEHSSWPTIPQIFIDGKFVGGCDILMELQKSGELQKLVDAAFAEA